METLTQTLERLAMTFTAKDIMVPKEELVCAPDEDSARRLLERYPDFDRIPIVENGRIKAYFDRRSGLLRPIVLEDLVSDATSILDLLSIFTSREFSFILTNDTISGYVHFSDLNKSVVKIPLFVIIETVERILVEKVCQNINENNLGLILSKGRVKSVKKKMRDMKDNRADLGWAPPLYFSELIHFACEFKIVKISCEEAETIIEVRNLVSHADNPLIERHSAVGRLSEANYICTSILDSMNRQK